MGAYTLLLWYCILVTIVLIAFLFCGYVVCLAFDVLGCLLIGFPIVLRDGLFAFCLFVFG